MSNGPMAGYADVLEGEELGRLVGEKEVSYLMKEFGERISGSIWDDDLLSECLDVDIPADAELWRRYRAFQRAFDEKVWAMLKATYPGACNDDYPPPHLHLCYHPDDEGCYDEISGLYWAIDGIWEKTPQALVIEGAIGHEIRRAFMVTYG